MNKKKVCAGPVKIYKGPVKLGSTGPTGQYEKKVMLNPARNISIFHVYERHVVLKHIGAEIKVLAD